MIVETLLCLIVGVTDGDTVTARCGAETFRVRLAEIDAPEKTQPFGGRSKHGLSELFYRQHARIEYRGRDRYGRTIGRITCGNTDANLAQVRAGLAWAYTKYLTDPSIKAAEQIAKESKRGLWLDPQPVPPWQWRKAAKRRASASP